MKKIFFIPLLLVFLGIIASCKTTEGSCDAYSFNSSSNLNDSSKSFESENSNLERKCFD